MTFSDAGSTPAASTIYCIFNNKVVWRIELLIKSCRTSAGVLVTVQLLPRFQKQRVFGAAHSGILRWRQQVTR